VSARRRVQVTIDLQIVQQSTGRVLFSRQALRAEGEYAERAEGEGRRAAIARLVADVVEGAQSQW
jgi:curli biogenesis system outer membrane secretion channel CsgG